MKNKLKSLLKHKKMLIAAVCIVLFLIAVNCSGDSSSTTGEGAVKLYKSVITEYTELLTAKHNGEELPAAEGEESHVSAALRKIVETCADPASMGYATRDINGDGVDELVLLSKGCDLYALFTLVDKKPVLLQAMDGKNAAIDENGVLYYTETVPDKSSFTMAKEIVDGALAGLEIGYTVADGGKWQYYKEVNGLREDSDNQAYLEKNNSFSNTFKRDTYVNKTAGFRFIPLISDDSAENDAPVLDLRTYDSVLEMYKTVIGLHSDFSADAWVQGLYDELYTFPDNESYAAFHGVLYASSAYSLDLTDLTSSVFVPALNAPSDFGYAYRDLDSDGTDELILLRSDYEILAVFTRDNGRAVLLTASTPYYRSIWIDGEGLIHIRVYTGGDSAQDYAYYLSEVSGKRLENLVAIAEEKEPVSLTRRAFYKLEGNKKVTVGETEWNELYARYDLFTEEAPDAKAYTKAYAGLTFTPLFD